MPSFSPRTGRVFSGHRRGVPDPRARGLGAGAQVREELREHVRVLRAVREAAAGGVPRGEEVPPGREAGCRAVSVLRRGDA